MKCGNALLFAMVGFMLATGSTISTIPKPSPLLRAGCQPFWNARCLWHWVYHISGFSAQNIINMLKLYIKFLIVFRFFDFLDQVINSYHQSILKYIKCTISKTGEIRIHHWTDGSILVSSSAKWDRSNFLGSSEFGRNSAGIRQPVPSCSKKNYNN